MNPRLVRNLRLKLAVTGAAALATLGFFGLMQAETPTRAGARVTATPITNATAAPATGPRMNVPPPATLTPANGLPAVSTQPPLPAVPAPRTRPNARTRAS